MRERPILFSGPMVRAILDGRKTQTRRVVKGVALDWLEPSGFSLEFVAHPENGLCPYGQPGDRLWVRETWFELVDPLTSRPFDPPQYAYRATHPDPYECTVDDGDGGIAFNKDGSQTSPWRPSIHMPRWASRITLEITDVRVERVQDISEDDARAEGIVDGGCLSCGESEPCGCNNPTPDARDAFCWLWRTIYPEQNSWESNPWVWVITFERASEGAP